MISRAAAPHQAFRHRNYRLFFGGQAISLDGDVDSRQVAQARLVLTLTRIPSG